MYSTGITCTVQGAHVQYRQHMYSTGSTCTVQAAHVQCVYGTLDLMIFSFILLLSYYPPCYYNNMMFYFSSIVPMPVGRLQNKRMGL